MALVSNRRDPVTPLAQTGALKYEQLSEYALLFSSPDVFRLANEIDRQIGIPRSPISTLLVRQNDLSGFCQLEETPILASLTSNLA